MSSFTKAIVEIDDTVDPCVYKLIEDFEYHIGEFPSTDVIIVKKGYETDLASVPRILWSVFPPNGHYAKAAIVHDYLYSNAIGTKAKADKIFYEAMGVLRIPKWKRKIMYLAVSLFGKGSYK